MSSPALHSPASRTRRPREDARHGNRSRLLLAFLCLLPLLVVYAILWRESSALPLLDDYHAIFLFALNQRSLSPVGKLIAVIAAQHVEYKLIFEHAVVAVVLA